MLLLFVLQFYVFRNSIFTEHLQVTALYLFNLLFIYLFVRLFIFNLFIVDKFYFNFAIRLPFHKQQNLTQTPGAVNNIAECWYC